MTEMNETVDKHDDADTGFRGRCSVEAMYIEFEGDTDTLAGVLRPFWDKLAGAMSPEPEQEHPND